MKGKVTGALCLVGFGILIRNPNIHDALNRILEARVLTMANWIRALTFKRSRKSTRPTIAASSEPLTATPEENTTQESQRRKVSSETKTEKTGVAKPGAGRQRSKSKRVTPTKTA